MATSKTIKRTVRHNRIRAKVAGTEERPRLSVFRSNSYIYAQVIDDDKGITIAESSSLKMKKGGLDAAVKVGKDIASKAQAKGVTKVVFDRGGFIYTGQIKALAESVREAGIIF